MQPEIKLADGITVEEWHELREPKEQPAQEPVAWMDSDGRFRLDYKTEIVRSIAAVNKEIPLYTHPHQWQGLTDDEIGLMISKLDIAGEQEKMISNFARAIEAKLKEKNHD